jgi:hypothetical protein
MYLVIPCGVNGGKEKDAGISSIVDRGSTCNVSSGDGMKVEYIDIGPFADRV